MPWKLNSIQAQVVTLGGESCRNWDEIGDGVNVKYPTQMANIIKHPINDHKCMHDISWIMIFINN